MPRVTVWGGIWSNNVIGPFFFEENVPAKTYLQMLKDNIIPEFKEHSAFLKKTTIWRQDSAQTHYGIIVRDYLDDTFRDWIGRRGTVEWLPWSPDLTPCDFSLWAIIKDLLYALNPHNINHLKVLIKEEFTSLNDNAELCRSICRFVSSHFQIYTNKQGKHFEHLFWLQCSYFLDKSSFLYNKTFFFYLCKRKILCWVH